MSCVHYKYRNSLDYDTITFDGLHISLDDLRKAIAKQKKLGKSTDFVLQVINAQTKEGEARVFCAHCMVVEGWKAACVSGSLCEYSTWRDVWCHHSDVGSVMIT